MKQIIALLLVAMLALSLAACGRSEPTAATEAPTETAADTTAMTEAETSTAPETEETAAGETSASPEEATTVAEQSSSAALQAPTDKAQILSLYNEGLKNTNGLQRVAYSREFLVCIFAVLGQNIDSLPNMSQKNIMGRDNQPKAHDLAALSGAQVKSAALQKQEGSLASYEILLQPAAADQSMPRGYGGYFGLLTYADITVLLDEAAGEGTTYNATVESFALSSGKLLVTIDLESGQIKSVEGSYIEDATGTVKVSILSSKLILQFDIRAAYKA